MALKRRDFLKYSAGTAGTALASVACAPKDKTSSDKSSDKPFKELQPITGDVVPISDEERLGRIEKAKRLMVENEIEAIYLEAGTSMFYYTGVRWWNSERMFGLVIPSNGDIAWSCPAFEKDRALELIRFGDDIRTWEENESPYRRIAEILQDRGVRDGKVGMEERVRFFLYDGIRKEAPHLEYISADPVTIGCRVIKSPSEIALMQKANDITIKAYKASLARLEKGMTKDDFRAISSAAHSALGVSGGIGAQIAEASANPHGSIKHIELKEGDIVLMDGGCNVDGYRSDISRTIVFGEPSKRQREMWNLAKKAQEAVFATAGVGVPCENADAAARQVYIDYGFPGGYELPGCPHRAGHGIGLDGHEWTYLVKGNETPMKPGMCFTNEPMLVIPGEFGVRLEDDFYITDKGPRYFTTPSPSIDKPFA
ncbi:MAG: aminopeptidase P family protein [Candidatus Aminicenantes bacterium]|nr:MAG: aminopeptidase P family protein [Candidatus Aminicenantes bacterium]